MKTILLILILLTTSKLAFTQDCKVKKHFRNDVLIEAIHFDRNGNKILVESYSHKVPNRLIGMVVYEHDSSGNEIRQFSAVSSQRAIDIVSSVQEGDTIYSIASSYVSNTSGLRTLKEHMISNSLNELTTSDVKNGKVKSSRVLDSTRSLVMEEREHLSNGSIGTTTFYDYNEDGVLIKKRAVVFPGDVVYEYELNDTGKDLKMIQIFKNDTIVRFERGYDKSNNLILEKESSSEKIYTYQYCPSIDKYVVKEMTRYWNEETRNKTYSQKFQYNEFCLVSSCESEQFRFKSKVLDRYEYIYYD